MLLRFIASKVIHALISSGLLGLVVAVMVMLHVRLYLILVKDGSERTHQEMKEE